MNKLKYFILPAIILVIAGCSTAKDSQTNSSAQNSNAVILNNAVADCVGLSEIKPAAGFQLYCPSYLPYQMTLLPSGKVRESSKVPGLYQFMDGSIETTGMAIMVSEKISNKQTAKELSTLIHPGDIPVHSSHSTSFNLAQDGTALIIDRRKIDTDQNPAQLELSYISKDNIYIRLLFINGGDKTYDELNNEILKIANSLSQTY